MNKNAIVTGASRGIGREIAKRLAADGFSVVVNYAGNAAKAEDVVHEISANGGRAFAVKADVSRAEEVAALFDRALTELGSVDVVVHSAGIMPLSPIADNNVEQFDNVIATNLRGAFLVLAQAARRGRTRRANRGPVEQRLGKVLSRIRGLYRFEVRS
jgi:3-oxoacyl-[acyl-carrier protein] reductase